MLIVLLVFIVLLLLRVPIALVLGISSLSFIILGGSMGLLDSVPQRLFSSVESYSLLAIPLFMLAGELMNSGGITTRLVDFSRKVAGHFRGGLAYVNVLANTFLASILGSATAMTAMMTRVMVPEMEKEGYKREFAAATTASAAMLGPIFPPSMLFIIYAVGSGVSVGKMFIAGIIPGIILAISLVLLIAFLGYKHNFPKSERASLKEVGIGFIRVIPALAVPGIIIGGILSGVFTATESAGVACLVAIIVGFFVYRDMKIHHIPKILTGAAMSTAAVTLLLAMAGLFGWVLAFDQVPQKLVAFMGELTTNPLVFLLLVNLFLLIVGVFLDELAVMIILLPIFMPLVHAYGIDPIHFGVVICLNATIGVITPPVGAGLFIASSVGDVKIEKLFRAVIPFIFVAIIVLALITYVPSLTTWLPSLLMK
jgi:tripartite ATP-independent transporter DctM subunit